MKATMVDFNVDEAWAEIKSFGVEASIKMDINGRWYVQQLVEQGGNGFLGGIVGRGSTPNCAVRAHLILLRSVGAPGYVVTNATQPNRTHWRWDGERWGVLPL